MYGELTHKATPVRNSLVNLLSQITSIYRKLVLIWRGKLTSISWLFCFKNFTHTHTFLLDVFFPLMCSVDYLYTAPSTLVILRIKFSYCYLQVSKLLYHYYACVQYFTRSWLNYVTRSKMAYKYGFIVWVSVLSVTMVTVFISLKLRITL